MSLPDDLRKEFEKLMAAEWGFLGSSWPVITPSKAHRSELKDVRDIDHVKDVLFRRLGVLTVFFFLVVLFGTCDYSGPYRNLEKGLLLLYQLVEGYSIAEMGRFIPKSSFYDVYKEFYIDRYDELDRMITAMLAQMFSTVQIRIMSARTFNPKPFKHITLLLDGHDTRASYPLADRGSLYSYKLKKSGFRTQICTDVNGMILFVSKSAPCRDNNDGTMFRALRLDKKVHSVDCVALDGGYTQFVSQVVDETGLTDANFCCPVRKPRGVDLTPAERRFNETFGSFRSKIEATFGEIMTTFKRFDNRSSIRVTDVKYFTLQLKLVSLLLNVRRFVALGHIPCSAEQSMWRQDKFDFPSGVSREPVDMPRASTVEEKMADAASIVQMQEEFLRLTLMENDETMSGRERDAYEVERILKHRVRNGRMEYLVRWVGYSKSDDSWVRESDFNTTECIDDYWRGIEEDERM